jgi:hypothetical protein
MTMAKAADQELGFETYVFDDSGRNLYVFRCVENDLNRSMPGRSQAANWNRASRIRAVLDGRRQRSDQKMLEIAVSGALNPTEAASALHRELDLLVRAEG